MCHIPYWVNLLAQNAVCDGVTFLIGSTLWPKTPFVTCVTFLIGPTCWPNFFFVTLSHSFLGQLYGPNRDQKLLKNSNTVKKVLKTVCYSEAERKEEAKKRLENRLEKRENT